MLRALARRGSASLLGTDSLEDDEVELWLEIPRSGISV